MIKKVIFALSARPKLFCGVGDYTSALVPQINAQSFPAEIDRSRYWNLVRLFGLYKKYRGQEGIGYHLQYPTYGMRASLAPFMLPLIGKTWVTLHEFEYFNILRKFALLPLVLFSQKIIFTNDYERDVFLRYFPFAKSKIEIIAIGNNIGITPISPPPQQRSRLVYFGQIVPNKGIDVFIDTVRMLRERGNILECSIIGSVVDQELWQSIQTVCERYQISIFPDLSTERVSEELQQSRYALLPFADGVSEKRGSALSCLVHGLTLITRHSSKTPGWMKEASYHADTPKEAADILTSLTDGTNTRVIDREKLGKALAEREWAEIARQHIALYQQL